MKKVLFTIIMLFVAICANSQHLLYEGIALDGTIDAFQKKLAAKGVKYNGEKTSELPKGQRAFSGIFHGYNSETIVYYDSKTQIVYKVETTIESKKQEVVQRILENSTNAIKKKYIYTTNHDEDDKTKLHLRYLIYSSKEMNNCLGVIHVKPSYLFSVPRNYTPGAKFELSAYIITFEYEDNLNTYKVLPSSAEPKGVYGMTCDEPEKLGEKLILMYNYLKEDCYDECIKNGEYALDFYKYGCVPNEFLGYEVVTDSVIIYCKNNLVATIKNTNNNIETELYKIMDNNLNEFKCLYFSGGDNSYNIREYFVKLFRDDIETHIVELTKLKKKFQEKKLSISSLYLSDDWNEDAGIYLPALVGQNNFRLTNTVEWERKTLNVYFGQVNKYLKAEIRVDSYRPILCFWSEEEIDEFVNFLYQIRTLYQ